METQVHRGGVEAERPLALLKLYLLGKFEVVREDAPIPAQAWRRRRPADLLKLVALSPGRTLSREAAIDALWPDKDPASGANNLHRALYDLRQILGGRWVDIEHGHLRMRSDVWVDVDAFERAVQQADRDGYALAVSLYAGDLSPEDRDSGWLAARRALLRGRFAEAAAPLARDAAERGETAAAIPLLRRLVEVEPTSEEPHRLLMRLLAEGGRRAEALRQYDACELALRSSGLGAPGPEMRALRDAIQKGEIGPTQTRIPLDGARRAARRLLGTTDPPPLRGRGSALLLLEALVEQGAGALVLLGERGVGKTRLALEGARVAQARGAAVVCGIAVAGASAPYALFADAFREEARAHPSAADPFAAVPGTGVPQEAVRLRLFDAVRSALVAVAEGRPIYLLLDDVHAADESSLNLLHFLARQARELRLMIVATCREEAVHAGTPIQMALAHLDGGRLARGVRVPRLGLAGTREQIADLLGGAAPEPFVAQVYRATDGSPFLTEEVVRAHRETGQLPSADAAAAIRGRVSRLGARAEALLAAAAVAGLRFDFEIVRPVAGLTGHEALAALEACLDARLLDEDGTGYHFHHSLARDAILDSLAADRRARLHGAIADALEAAAAAGGHEPPAEAVAWHRRRAGQDDRALRALLAAGHRAAARAGHREALGFYSEAIELLERTGAPGGPERIELLDAMGRVQLALGEASGAVRTFSAAARFEDASGFRSSPEQRARARHWCALAHVTAGDLGRAQGELQVGLGDAAQGRGDDIPGILHLDAQILWHEGRLAEAYAVAERCAEAAERIGDADLFARGRDLAALARAMGGAPLPAPEDRTGAAERQRQDTAPEHPLDVHLVLWDRDLLGDLACDDVARAAGLLAERARQRDAPDALAVGRTGEGSAALAAGRLDVAEAALRDAIALHRTAGSALGEALALERLATLLVMRGRLAEAQDVAGDGVVVAERAFLRRHALIRLHAAEARARLAAGTVYAAEDAIREASETAARHGECVVCDAAFRPEAVRVALARGRIDDAAAEALQLEEIARQRGGRVLGAIARLARARVLAAEHRDEDAVAALAVARAAFLAAGRRYEAARCLRLEHRLRGAAALEGEGLAELDALVVLDADA